MWFFGWVVATGEGYRDRGDEGAVDLSRGEDEARPNTAATETKQAKGGTDTKGGKKGFLVGKPFF